MNIEFEKYIKDTLEAKELKNAYQFWYDKVEEMALQFIENQFVKTADEKTIREWEIFLSIPEDLTLSLEERRSQILLKLLVQPPYTKNAIRKQLTGIVGQDVEITEGQYYYVGSTKVIPIYLELSGVSSFSKKLVSQYMAGVKPVNVVYYFQTTIESNFTEYYATAISQTNIYEVEFNYTDTEYSTWGEYENGTWQDVMNKGKWSKVFFK